MTSDTDTDILSSRAYSAPSTLNILQYFSCFTICEIIIICGLLNICGSMRLQTSNTDEIETFNLKSEINNNLSKISNQEAQIQNLKKKNVNKNTEIHFLKSELSACLNKIKVVNILHENAQKVCEEMDLENEKMKKDQGLNITKKIMIL